jgi:hypothetical protein
LLLLIGGSLVARPIGKDNFYVEWLQKIKQRQRTHRISVPADRVLKAIIAPKKFTAYDESSFASGTKTADLAVSISRQGMRSTQSTDL